MSTVGARARDYSAKRAVERIRDGDDELNESSATARGQQRQQKAQTQQGVENKEKIIDDLRDAGDCAGTAHFALSLNDFIDGAGTKFSCELLDSLVFANRMLGRVFGNLSLNFSLDLCLNRAVLLGPAGLFHCQLVVFHCFPLCERSEEHTSELQSRLHLV